MKGSVHFQEEEEKQELPLSKSPEGRQEQDGSHPQAKRRDLRVKPSLLATLIFTCPDSRAVRNKFLIFQCPAMVFHYCNPNRLKQECSGNVCQEKHLSYNSADVSSQE
jgi:hypothetical protein